MKNKIVCRIKSVVWKFSGSVISCDCAHFVSCTKTKFWFFDLSFFKIHQMGRDEIGLSQNSIGWKFRANDASVAANRIIISKLWSWDGLLYFTRCRNKATLTASIYDYDEVSVVRSNIQENSLLFDTVLWMSSLCSISWFF